MFFFRAPVLLCIATVLVLFAPSTNAISESKPATISQNDEPTSPLAGGRNQHIVAGPDTFSGAEPLGDARDPLAALPSDLISGSVFDYLSNRDRLALMVSTKKLYNSEESKDLRARFQALRPSKPDPLPTDCPPAVANALMPENSLHFNMDDVNVLSLSFSPRAAHPLTTGCLQALVAEFQRYDSLFSHIQTLDVNWDSEDRLPSVDVPTFEGLWSAIQGLLDNPPPSLTTLSISSDLLTGVSMGNLRRLVLDLHHWNHADPVDSFLRAAAPQMTSLALKRCKTEALLASILTALQLAPLEELTFDWPKQHFNWTSLWDTHLESLRHLTHFKFRQVLPNALEDLSGLWTRVVCHPDLVSFDVNWRQKLEDLVLRRTTECIANNPSLRKFVASQVSFTSPDPKDSQRHKDLKAYLAVVAKHPTLEEWSAPSLHIVRDEEIPFKQLDALRSSIQSFQFPLLRTLWWSIPSNWPDSFPNVKKLVVSMEFLGLVANIDQIHALPPALDALVVAGRGFGQFRLDPTPTMARPHLCQVKTLVFSINEHPAHSAPSIPLSSLAAEATWELGVLGIMMDIAECVVSPQTVNGVAVQVVENHLRSNF